MTVGVEKLVHMAEQIAANVSVSEDPDVVAKKVADHLRRFWDPRMRAALVAHAAREPAALSPPLTRAVAQLDKV